MTVRIGSEFPLQVIKVCTNPIQYEDICIKKSSWNKHSVYCAARLTITKASILCDESENIVDSFKSWVQRIATLVNYASLFE